MFTKALLLGLVALVSTSNAAYCHGKPDPNAKPNSNPINSVAPKLVRTVPNGKAFTVGTPGNEFWVLHVYGTAYEMGYAHGSLMRSEARDMLNQTWTYLESQVEDALNGLPNWLKIDLANAGLDIALDWTYEHTKNFTGQYFYDELRGISDATGVDYQTLVRIHLIGELTQGDCSMFGAWSKATKASGKTFQLRALDWDVDGPFKDFPAVVVYHPSDNGHAFANLGFIGWIGTLSGQSSTQLAVSEIGISFPDATFGKESRSGVPFTFLLRDILQFDNTYEDSIKRITDAHRTCDLVLGVGDGKAATMREFQYSASVANVMDDTNLMPLNDTWHARIEDVVYTGMDWDCPAYNSALHDRLMTYYGDINAENTIHGIVPVVQTGNLHIAVYDLTDSLMYVSVARRSNGTGPQYAYDRNFTMLDLNSLWKEPKPSTTLQFE